ncbi:MFS transporter, partial [Georgenia sp. 10Sc9-8]|nr:MFS transporter [Georgenia halotolerans]
LTPLLAGVVLTPFALTGAVSAGISGRLVPRFGRWTVVAGLVVMIVGLVGTLITVSRTIGPQTAWAVSAWMALAGAGNGFVISPNQALGLAEVPVEQSSTAGAVLQTSQRVGAAVGVAVITGVFFATLSGADPGDAARYGQALSLSMGVTVGMVGLSLAVAVTDALRRVRPAD